MAVSGDDDEIGAAALKALAVQNADAENATVMNPYRTRSSLTTDSAASPGPIAWALAITLSGLYADSPSMRSSAAASHRFLPPTRRCGLTRRVFLRDQPQHLHAPGRPVASSPPPHAPHLGST